MPPEHAVVLSDEELQPRKRSSEFEERVAPPGSMFGQLSLLNGSLSQTDIQTRTDMIVLRLPGDAFMRLAMQFPAMLATVSEASLGDVVSIHR